MTAKKKVESSCESTSGTSSASSTSTSSSSGTDSSSSSDSDSSSSHEVSKLQTQGKSQAAVKATSSIKSQNVAETKKSVSSAIQKTHRRSTEIVQKSTTTKSVDKKSKPPPTKSNLQKPVPKVNVYSSDDDDDDDNDDEEETSKLESDKKKLPQKKSTVKPKTSATVMPKVSSHSSGNRSNTNKGMAKSSKTIQKPTQKEAPKLTSKQVVNKNALKSDLNKKKSIFSPENSSDSDGTSNSKTVKQLPKSSNQKPRTKASPRTLEKPKPIEKPKVEKKAPPKSKAIVSSGSSATSSTESSSSSDCESSGESTLSLKQSSEKRPKKITASSKPSKESHTDSEGDKKQVTRKLTRSASTRKSKHVLGNVYSDTDSDTESTKRSLSRSPVKKAPVVTKGKTKNTKRNNNKTRATEIPILEERKCPVEGCNSMGHLGGRFEKHFTIEACPMYHNMTPQQCKEQYLERKKREEFRKKALECFKKSPRTHPTSEQKQYLHKVKELRSKFKAENSDEPKSIVDKNKEPNLNSVVPDYDLKLFRDAQAIASEKIEEELEKLPNCKGTKYVEMGKFEMEVWYQSPYPEDYARLPKLYICEYCLRYMKSRTVLQRHVVKCVWRHPPGEEVYRKDKISVWEVDGKRYKQYCQNLCLLAKFFLDHKTLYYDVEPFLFYVMTMADNEGCHTVGYFSKEKNSFLNYNVSCILTLPPYQRQGYGRLLIDFSYLLTRTEGKIGSPEKPLSDLGLISYRSYWKDVLLGYLCSRPGTTLSVKDISQEMAIHSYDIVSTLQALGMMKYWKGKHIILKKQDVLDEYVERVNRRGSLLKEVDASCLRWKPFVPPQPAPV